MQTHQAAQEYYNALPRDTQVEIAANADVLRDAAHRRGRQMSEATASDAIVSLYHYVSATVLRRIEAEQ